MAKVIKFEKNERSTIETESLKDFLMSRIDQLDTKMQLLDTVKEECGGMLEKIGLHGQHFEIEEDSLEMFLDAPLEIYTMDPEEIPPVMFSSMGEDAGYRIDVQIIMSEELDQADIAFALFKMDQEGCRLYDPDRGWVPVPVEEFLGVCDTQIGLITGDDPARGDFAEFTRISFGKMTNETFAQLSDMYEDLISLYDDVGDYCTFGWYKDGEKEYPMLIPKCPAINGIAVTADDGVYQLCQFVPVRDAALNEWDMPPLAIPVREAARFDDREALEESLAFMIDHYFDTETMVIPISKDAYMRSDSLQGEYFIFTGHELSEAEHRMYDETLEALMGYRED